MDHRGARSVLLKNKAMIQTQYPTKNYVVWDLETSGLDFVQNRIIEIGYAIVKDGEVSETKSMLLKHPGLQISTVTTELTGITQDMIDKEGIEPTVAYGELLKVLKDTPHVTHNGMRFDIPFLIEQLNVSHPTMSDVELLDFIDMMFRNAIDTAVFFKAKKLNLMRRYNESFKNFSSRVMDQRVYGLKYSVPVCCAELGVDVAGVQRHRAVADLLLTNEIYKKIIA